jgi:hypothetical protein
MRRQRRLLPPRAAVPLLALLPALTLAGPAPAAKPRATLAGCAVQLGRCAGLRCPEIVEMLWAVANGSDLGPGAGWFHPGRSRYGWAWLAQRHGVASDGRIPRKRFRGPAELFDRLDRDRDGALTAADFDWSEHSPLLQTGRPADLLYFRLDADSNGRITRAEWDAFFHKAAKGKKYLTPEDLRAALTALPPAKVAKKKPPDGPSPLLLVKGFLSGELGSIFEGPDIDAPAPDFTLPAHDGKKKFRLADYRGKRPVVLVFGSFT